MKAITKLLCFLSVVALLSAYVFGQREAGTITGTVTDPSGAVVSGATVTVKSVGTGATRTVTTNAAGAYTVAGLQPGQYDVTIESPNFAKFTQRISVTVGSTNEVSAKLSIVGQGTTVEVVGTGGGTQVETQSSELSQVVSGTSVTQLPSLTRNPYDFVATAGNVAEDQGNNTVGRGANNMSINGQRVASTDVLLDGAENVDLFTASVGQQVPLDAVQEFRVTTSTFTADTGRASGGVVNVATKSGTNAFHGSAYEFNRLSALASNTYDNGANGVPKSVFTRNQFGYSIGGPIVKDKLFFFNSTEWTRVRANANQLAYVLDPAFLGLSSPELQSFMNLYGKVRPNASHVRTLTAADLIAEGNAGGTGGPFDALAGANPGLPVLDEVQYAFPSDVGGGLPQNTWNSVVRVDYNLSDKTQMFARYAVFHDNFFAGTNSSNAYAGYDTGIKDLNQNVLFSVTHIWSPTVLTNTKLSFNRLNNQQPLGAGGALPNLYYTLGGQVNVGPDSQTTMLPGYLPTSTGNAIPFGGPQNVAQIGQDLSWTHGKHQFKFGGSYIYERDNRVFGAYEEGENFLGAVTPNEAFDAMLTGQLFRFSVAIDPAGKFPCFRNPATNAPIQTPECTLTGPASAPNFSRSNRYNDGNLYAMDTFKITNRLTLNLGIRWEYYGVQHDKHLANDANLVLGTGSSLFQQIATATVQNGANLPDSRLWNPEYHDFAPRLGFAYDLFGDGKTSLRGGYGIAYERNFGNVTFNVIQNPPNYAVLNITNGQDVPSLPLTTSNFGFAGAPGAFPFRSPTLRAVDRHIKTAYAHMWNLSVEREVARNTVVALEYSGSRGVDGYSISPFNEPGAGPVYLANSPRLSQRLNLQYNAINYRTNGGDSYHHALNTRFQTNNIANTGLSLTANYTWSHTIDNLSATFGSSDEFNSQALGFLDPFNPKLDIGDADYDVRHRLVMSAIWDVPLGKNSTGALKQVIGGWEFAPILNARTGYPYTIYDCSNSQLGGFNCPRYIPSAPVGTTGSTSTSAGNSLGPNVFNYQTLALPIAYVTTLADGTVTGTSEFPTCTTFGGGGCTFPADMTRRNQFRQPGFWNMNLGIYKNFKLTERFGLQFRSEFYNLFNHSNYYVQTGSGNAISGILSDVIATPQAACGGNSCLPGQLEYTIPYNIQGKKGSPQGLAGSLGERRFVQLALKLTF
ncbi:MAG TPA: TonB-dependent receptor [Terriglobales bacterium]|nr:TonB-dependent receptor [Terriglobales bacterium]